MRHVIMSKIWQFSRDPFPAFRANLVFGRNKHDRTFLPVQGVVPGEDGLLPGGQFKIIKTKEKGTILVVNGRDDTDRTLLLVSSSGGFRGGVRLVEDATDGQILALARAASACESGIALAALMDVGQQVVFHSFGRRTNDVYVYVSTPDGVERRTYTLEEWRARNASIEDAETL